MSQEIHYEIFRRQGAKGGWMLHEVVSGRERRARNGRRADGR